MICVSHGRCFSALFMAVRFAPLSLSRHHGHPVLRHCDVSLHTPQPVPGHPDPHAAPTPSLRDNYRLKDFPWAFPSGPAFRTLHFQCRGRGLDHWSGDGIPYATESFQKNKKDFPQLLLTETLRKMLSDF